jgi:formylglycine-generating enzyme required for sulfatase activity
MELQRYVRRAGYEADMHLLTPAEFEADTSVLVQMLKKGHYNVTLTRNEWERLYTWIDYNLPYPAHWRESHRPPRDEQVARRADYQKRFAEIDDRDEEPLPLPPVARFEAPLPLGAPPATPTVDGWPLAKEQAQKLQKDAGPAAMELDLGDGVKMKLALIPAGRFVMGTAAGFPDEAPPSVVSIAKPFYMGTLEVTNRQYACYDARHDSGVIEGRGKDRTTRGTPIHQPDAPVVRVAWNEVLGFCEWLTQKTGQRCTLPTEAQWEWAARAGTASTFHFGEYQAGMNNLANVADAGIANWNYGRAEPGYNDGAAYSAAGARYAANAWGLFDMHGNVAEWCLSAYRPYPYRDDDGRNDPRAPGLKVVRGGSWNDTLRYATSASRWRFQPYQPVYNVGFRVVCLGKAAPAVADSRAIGK